jgi:hypothetical protein
MKQVLTLAFFTLLSTFSFAQDGRTYKPDENHLPGSRSPEIMRQAQEEHPAPKKLHYRHLQTWDHRSGDEYGSKVGPNPEAISLPNRDLKK